MKFYLTVAIAAILLTGTVSAQHLNIGIKGGLNLYNIQNSDNAKYDAKTGFHLGLLGHIHLDRQWAVQPEVVYSSQGAKYSTGSLDTKLKLGYVNVPVMLQYMFDNGFRLQAGPQVGILTNAKSNIEKTTTDVKSDFKTVDFGVGVGVAYVNPSTGFGVDARYNLGLSNINENTAVTSTNRGFQLGVFYLIGHK